MNPGLIAQLLVSAGPAVLRTIGHLLKGRDRKTAESIADTIEGAVASSRSRTKAVVDQLQGMRQAELLHVEKMALIALNEKNGMRAMDIQEANIYLRDIQSARSMQAHNKEVFGVQKLLSFSLIFIALGLYLGGGIMWYNGHADATIIFTNIATGFVSQVIGFWLGSSSGSKMKDLASFQPEPKKKLDTSLNSLDDLPELTLDGVVSDEETIR